MKINKITAFFLAFLMIALIFPVFGASADTGGGQPAGAMDFEQALSALRSEFFNEPGIRGRSGGLDLTPVYMDDSDVIHTPPEYLEPIYDENYTGTGDYTGLQQNYIEGSTRNFRAQVTANSTDVTPVLGKLVKQGSHVNLWVLDKAAYDTASGGAANDQCALEDIADDTALLNEIAAKFDGIFEAMTEYFGKYKGVKITTHFGNMPAAGDIDNDGRVNILMYNIRSKPASGSPYTAGFFSSGDFFNDNGNIPISLFHMDIARDYGYRNVTGTPEQKVVFYDTFAHEFQHLLFYMYFGVYAPNVTISEYSWFNESLSELAGTFYSQEGAEVISRSRIIDSAVNSYENSSNYGDFLRFNNSFKNYGMSNMHSALMHKKTNGTYIKNVYNYFKEYMPLSTTGAEYGANRGEITAAVMTNVVGSAFAKAELNGQLPVTGSELFDLLYFIFMENFASDGGNIIVPAEESVQTRKFHSSTFSAFNLWGIRPAFGESVSSSPYLGAIFSDDSNSFTSMTTKEVPTVLTSGDNLSLTGYNNGSAASHDMLYRLTGVTETEPFLNISIADSSTQTRYYAVIPREAPETQLNRHRGQFGADVYPLAVGGAANFIDTNGRPAYLFVSTLQRNVNSVQVTYSWTDTVPIMLESIAVTVPPTKTVYIQGETLNLAGLVITATYSNGNTQAVTGFTATPANGAALDVVGTQTVTLSYTEDGVTRSTTFDVTVNPIPITLESIAVTVPPTKTVYIQGETLNLAGMVITATYSNGNTQAVTGFTATPANGAVLNVVGTQTVTISYNEDGVTRSTTFDVTVNPVPITLESIAVTVPPTKTVYTQGETLNLAGMVVTATYSNGNTQAVTGFTATPANGAALDVVGTQTVMVSYTEDGVTRSTTFDVTVNPITLESIAVTVPPTKTVYTQGETLNLAGLVVTATYSNGNTQAVTGFTATPANGTALNIVGTQTVTISHTEDGVTRSTTFDVTVNPIPITLESIAVTVPPTKIVYTQGETLNLAGLVVTATYSNGNTQAVTGFTATPANGAALDVVGTQTVTVSYTEDGVTRSTTFDVTVNPIPITLESIAVTAMPTKIVYTQGETLNLAGMVITATYSNGNTQAVTGFTATPANGAALNVVGTQTVTISYTEDGVTRSTTFDVTVNPITLESIAVTVPPTKTVYIQGETLNLAGLVVTATYSDGNTQAVTGFTVTPANGAVLDVVGTQTVTVSYTEDGVTRSTTFDVTVNPSRIIIASGDDAGPTASWILYDDGELEITGTGEMWNWTWEGNAPTNDPPWYDYNLNIINVNVSENVITIGNDAFFDCINLTYVYMPSVTGIGNSAFSYCINLENIDMPNVTTIGESAFFRCTNLTNINMQNVISIGWGAFQNCTNLTSIYIPKVTSIGWQAFRYCTSLTNITVASNNPNYTTIDGVLFNKNITTLIAYPGGKTDGYTVPSSVTNIGIHAFAYCFNLTNVIMLNVTTIGEWAFEYCNNLISVYIPNITSIGEGAFWGCTNLFDVYFNTAVPPTVGTDAFHGITPGARAIVPADGTWPAEGTLWHGLTIVYAQTSTLCDICGQDPCVCPEPIDDIRLLVLPETPVSRFTAVFGAETTIVNRRGETLNSIDYVGTGAVIKLPNGNKLTAIVYGDLIGDGYVGMDSVVALARHIAALEPFDDGDAALLEAADVNGDGRINIADLIRLARYHANVDPSPLG